LIKNEEKLILTLIKELPEALANYFAEKEIKIISRAEVTDYKLLSFILVETLEEAKVASSDFSCEKNEITVICVGTIREMRDFLMLNGRLVIAPELADNKWGRFILDKYFNQKWSLHFDDNQLENTVPQKEIKITNHLTTGIYFDEIAVDSFEQGYNVVSIRSYLDHLIYYLTYLKQAGLAGIPIEIEYTWNQDVFALNIHCSIKNFVAEYLIDSFGPVNSTDPLKFLLGVCYRSCDFLEVSYIENPGRLLFTSYWSKSNSINKKGIVFNNIYTTSQAMIKLEDKITQFHHDSQIGDKSESMKLKHLPGSILEMVISQNHDSLLGKKPEQTGALVAFIVAKFEEVYPDRSVNDIELEELINFSLQFQDQEFVQTLQDSDHQHLLERVQKNNITKAYDEELTRVRGQLEDKDDYKKELKETLTEEVAKRVSGHVDAETLNRILGQQDDADLSQIVKGSKDDADDFIKKISSTKEQDKKGEFAQSFGSGLQKKLGEFNVKFSNNTPEEKKKNMQWLVKASLKDAAKKANLDLKVQSYIEKTASDQITNALTNYAAQLGIDQSELSAEQLQQFNTTEAPTIINAVLEDEFSINEFKQQLEKGFDRSDGTGFSNMSSQFQTKFKAKLEEKLAGLNSVAKIDNQYLVTDESLSDVQMQTIIQSTIKETFDEELNLAKASKDELEVKEKEIVENLTHLMSKDELEIKTIIKPATQAAKDKEVQTVVNNLFSSSGVNDQGGSQSVIEAELLKKIKTFEIENKRLESQVQSFQMQLNAKKDAEAKMATMSEEIKAQVAVEIQPTMPEHLSNLDHADLASKAQELATQLNESQINLKKTQLEVSSKEALFKSELEKLNRQLKGKDLVVEKIKESMMSLIGKKEKELKDLNRKVEELNQRLHDDESVKLKAQVKSLQMENESAAKATEIYKNKLESFINSKKANEKADNTQALTEENRQLKTLKNQLDNKIASLSKENRSFEDRYNKLKALEEKFRTESTTVKTQYKELENKFKALKDNETRLLAMMQKSEDAQKGASAKEVELLKAQNEQLQLKIKEFSEKMQVQTTEEASSAGEAQSPKEKHLEKTNKALQAEISKVKTEIENNKKEMLKMKGEATGLKNKIKALEREVDKYKKAAPAKKAA
jgi:hypothetical protein